MAGMFDDPTGEISREISAAHKRAFGKGPDSIRSTFLDDMLIVVAKGGITPAERTLLDHGHEEAVRASRRLVEESMDESLRAIVAKATGRDVVSFQSQIMFAPDRVIAVFIFEDDAAGSFGASNGAVES